MKRILVLLFCLARLVQAQNLDVSLKDAVSMAKDTLQNGVILPLPGSNCSSISTSNPLDPQYAEIKVLYDCSVVATLSDVIEVDKTQQIIFYDTKNLDQYKNNVIRRYRSEDKDYTVKIKSMDPTSMKPAELAKYEHDRTVCQEAKNKCKACKLACGEDDDCKDECKSSQMCFDDKTCRKSLIKCERDMSVLNVNLAPSNVSCSYTIQDVKVIQPSQSDFLAEKGQIPSGLELIPYTISSTEYKLKSKVEAPEIIFEKWEMKNSENKENCFFEASVRVKIENVDQMLKVKEDVLKRINSTPALEQGAKTKRALEFMSGINLENE